jgi:hypothetical protein
MIVNCTSKGVTMFMLQGTVLSPFYRAMLATFTVFMGLLSKEKLLALPVNIRLGWNWLKVANTPAYYNIKIRMMPNFLLVKTPRAVFATPGSVKANGRESKSCLVQVFNFKLGCFVMCTTAQPIQWLSLELKTRPRFHPLGLGLSMSTLFSS